ncbi:MAG TPA: DUF1810 domain-containing protein [Sphingomicrobium sp.]|nr:DUF1810 domain-containing protein [Sphingomicrobium sp.]
MAEPYNLQRFVDAQQGIIDVALAELRAGQKQSHWMWFVFPQLAELGRSPTAKFYGIASFGEAKAYLDHPLLQTRLEDCLGTLLPWARRRSAEQIFSAIDALKLRSSLTLFDYVQPSGPFSTGLDLFFAGCRDQLTLALLNPEG